jgi:hypothetical protein
MRVELVDRDLDQAKIAFKNETITLIGVAPVVNRRPTDVDQTRLLCRPFHKLIVRFK